MLARFEVQHYKSLYDVKVDLEPLTVFIGPNGSGKSNVCESLAVLSKLLEIVGQEASRLMMDAVKQAIAEVTTGNRSDVRSKFWHGEADYLKWSINSKEFTVIDVRPELFVAFDYPNEQIRIASGDQGDSFTLTSDAKKFWANNARPRSLANRFGAVKVYDFSPANLSGDAATTTMNRLGDGLAYSLVDILHANRAGFDELEERFRRLVPNIERIVLPRHDNQTFTLELADKFSKHHIPSSEISDGTLRILAFLAAIYQDETPSILCFEELENGVHPWLLHKMMELLKIVSTEGVTGKPVQVIITTHSPVLLNYVEPHQVRAVELDAEGKTQIHALPTETARFQKAMEAYDGALGELWFTGIFGGNPA
jgi:predicted ATPase